MRLYLGGYLDFYHPERKRWLDVEIDQPSLISEVLTRLGIPLGDVHLIAINGQTADLHTAIVAASDEVRVFSPVGGG